MSNRFGRAGAELWIDRRVRRMADVGRGTREIAHEVGIEESGVRGILKRSPSKRFGRCKCGAMTRRQPCLACVLIATMSRSIRPIGHR
jgi:hypothetical protein